MDLANGAVLSCNARHRAPYHDQCSGIWMCCRGSPTRDADRYLLCASNGSSMITDVELRYGSKIRSRAEMQHDVCCIYNFDYKLPGKTLFVKSSIESMPTDNLPLPRSDLTMISVLISHAQNRHWRRNFQTILILILSFDFQFDFLRFWCIFFGGRIRRQIWICEPYRSRDGIEESTLLPVFVFRAYCLLATVIIW